jgi:hypothetical protein
MSVPDLDPRGVLEAPMERMIRIKMTLDEARRLLEDIHGAHSPRVQALVKELRAQVGVLHRECEFCHRIFQARKTSRRYCSDKCRLYAWRREQASVDVAQDGALEQAIDDGAREVL